MAKSGSKTSNERKPDAGRREWMSVGVAIAGVVVSLLSVGVAYLQFRADEQPTNYELIISSKDRRESDLLVTGEFSRVHLGAEVILVLGKKPDPETGWLPVEATTTPTTSEGDGRTGGFFEAVFPGSFQPISLAAVVAPRAVGAQNGFTEIARDGPASELVLASSQEVMVDAESS